jgi:disulfide bond formation protein DsbB
VAGALVLGGLALRRGPRRAAVIGLVLLLALFAFEDALHSVHHGFDPKQAETCTIAAASGHVSGVAVDAVVGASMILMPVGQAVEPDRSPLPLHRLAPDQGRAPPALPA